MGAEPIEMLDLKDVSAVGYINKDASGKRLESHLECMEIVMYGVTVYHFQCMEGYQARRQWLRMLRRCSPQIHNNEFVTEETSQAYYKDSTLRLQAALQDAMSGRPAGGTRSPLRAEREAGGRGSPTRELTSSVPYRRKSSNGLGLGKAEGAPLVAPGKGVKNEAVEKKKGGGFARNLPSTPSEVRPGASASAFGAN